MSESIGAAIKRARTQRGLSLAQVSEATRIRAHYLQALENDDISAMPSAAQARGFMKIYTDFLGVDLGKLIPPPVELPPAPIAIEEPTTMPTARPAPMPGRPRLLSWLRERIATVAAREPDAAAGTPQESTPEGGVTPPKAERADKKKAPN